MRNKTIARDSTCFPATPKAAFQWLSHPLLSGQDSGQDTGQSAVELALVLPILLLLMTGTMAFAIAMTNYLALYEATSVGARQLSISRGQGGDPCAMAGAALAAAAPLLNNNGPVTGIGYTFTIYSSATSSVTYSGNPPSCSNATLVQGQTVTISTTYPCVLKAYAVNFAPTCVLQAKVTEISQ